MSDAIDRALSLMLAACVAPSAESNAKIVQVTIKAGKVQRVKGTALPNVQGETKLAPVEQGSKDPALISHAAPPPLCFFPVGTLDARGFLRAINAAPSRDLRIQAIAAFIGYNRAGDFCSQEFNARSTAQRMMRKVDPSVADLPLRGEQRSIVRSVEGFVAGLPNGAAREARDLQARARLASESLAEYTKIASDPKASDEQRLTAEAQAMTERERISQIEADLSRLLPTDQAAE